MRARWTAKERARLRKLWPDMPAKQVSEAMGRSLSAIHNQAHLMGLKKSPEFMRSMIRWTAKNPCQFEKGLVPWNKGKRGVNGHSATSFKPGNLPHNTQPIGFEKTDKDGNLLRKVSNTRIRKKDWRPVHVLIWESINGPVPKGKLIVFADRNQRNFAPENLISVTRKENMERNSLHRYPKELVGLVRIQGRLNRQIKRANENHR